MENATVQLLKFMVFLVLPVINNKCKRTDSWGNCNKLRNLVSHTLNLSDIQKSLLCL